MLKELTPLPQVVRLIPNTGVQFLDLALNEDAAAGARRSFFPEKLADEGTGPPDEGDAERERYRIHPVAVDGEGQAEILFGARRGDLVDREVVFQSSASKAFELFDRAWLPLPMFRRTDAKGFDFGPTTWARVRVARIDDGGPGAPRHRVTVAFDTLLTPRAPAPAPYAAPEATRDAEENVSFGLATDQDAIMALSNLPWIEDWLADAYLAGLSRARDGRVTSRKDIRRPGDHLAHYWAFLDGLAAAAPPPDITLADVFGESGRSRFVDTTLVMDLGNSRTAGVFIETRGDGGGDLGDTALLELRNLSEPEQASSDPFESRVEFHAASFGRPKLVKAAGRIGRREPFVWPSPLRVGPEATALAAHASGVDGATGMSSPKRYLWDVAARPHDWRNNQRKPDDKADISGPITVQLTSDGRVVKAGGAPGGRRLYSRSSLYMMLIVELIAQAACQLNSVAHRRRFSDADLPRRLTRIVLPMPSATPVSEQKLMKERVKHAIELFWTAMGWDPNDPLHRKPELELSYDEASVTHLVFLYNELRARFRARGEVVFPAIARGRVSENGVPAVRIASIDIGGGTTDFMVIEHEAVGDGYIKPRQLFREGFRIAGDDLLKSIVERVIAPGVARDLVARGQYDAATVVAELFNGNNVRSDQASRTRRGRFVSQVFASAAVGALQVYESFNGDPDSVAAESIGQLIARAGRPVDVSAGYLEDRIHERGLADYALAGVKIEISAKAIEDEIRGAFRSPLGDLADLARSFHCDYVLLTGRIARIKEIRNLVLRAAPTTPDRVISMSDYSIAQWYPFRAPDGRIEDPKSTAVVGAMLAEITRRGVPGFRFGSEELRMRSTARFVGVLEQNNELLEPNVIGENVETRGGRELEFRPFRVSTREYIGFRQLPLERWPATPLYVLTLGDNPPPSAIEVQLVRRDLPDEDVAQESAYEDFEVRDAKVLGDDTPGYNADQEVKVRLQTLRTDNDVDGGYWLDTGVLNTAAFSGDEGGR